MTVGAGMLGRDAVLAIAGQPIAGVTTKGISIANEAIDVSSDDSAGYRELMAQSGMSTLDLSVSGVVKNLELMRSIITNESKMYAFTLTYTDGSVLAFDGFFATHSQTGEHSAAFTFDSSFQSSGAYTFTPGP
jgi:predicted secreted protein